MTRRIRSVAGVALVVLLVASAGCSALDGGAATNLLLVNNDNEKHDITVEITSDDEAEYSMEKTLPPESQADLSPFEGSGEYVVAVTVDGSTTERTYEFSSDDDTLSIGVQNDASVIVDG